MHNPNSLDTLCAALAYAMGIDAPEHAASPSPELCAYVDEKFGGKKADKIVMFNPDAIGQWVMEKYPELCAEATSRAEISLPFACVMPSVTPVCFGTMYTGAQPSVHGIQKYEKPVIAIESIFDMLIKAGKKPAIVAVRGCSLAHIFNEKEMDYFIYPSYEAVNAKAVELICDDSHDFIVVYNGNFDSTMHKQGPESIKALGELRANARTYGMFCELVSTRWKKYNTLVGFAMDHGCHEIDGECGSHGLDMDEDINIMHLFRAYPAAE